MSGTVVFVGGYSWSGEALRSMMRAAGSPRPVVVPTAAMFEGTGAAINAVRHMLANSDVDVVSIPRRVPPTDAIVNSTLAAARFIIFAGESAIHLRSVMTDTEAWNAVLQAWADGAVLVGIGGAAAALADPMIDDRGGAFTLGLGVVGTTAVLPHADQWGQERMRRTTRLVSKGVALVAINDDAALVWHPESGWEAHGNVKVTLNGETVPVETLPPPVGMAATIGR